MTHKDKLLELAANPDFISGIYNYCDRWCERCQFTSRCFLYATEQADPDLDDPEIRDISNEKFWRKLQSIFMETAEMIAEWAAEAGIDLDAVDIQDAKAEHEREMASAEQNELSLAARHYAGMVADWFKEEFATEEDVHDDAATASEPGDEDLSIRDAAEVIRWYQFFIAVKIFRALSGGSREDEPDDEDGLFGVEFFEGNGPDDNEDVDYDAVVARADRMDANGSAKVALIAIDRSISAWRALQIWLPEKAGSITPMLIELERLRRSTEQNFPHARSFIRPGFDETLSEFVS